MKITTRIVIAAAFSILAACGVGNNAMAASNDLYKSTSGKPFSISDVRQITFDASNATLSLVYTSGATSENFSDNGSVFAKIKADHPEWLTYGTNILLVPAMARTINCFGSGTGMYTTMAWRNTGAQDFPDGCVTYQQAQQKANN